jgi:hypothetical protein
MIFKIFIMILITGSGSYAFMRLGEFIERKDLRKHQKTLIDHEKI